jgi:hypothetical protein
MILPEKLPLTSVSFMDGGNGYKLQVYENKELGIGVVKERVSHKAHWTFDWSISILPGKVFKSYKELNEAVKDR